MTIRVKRKTAIITTVAFLLLAGGIALVMIQIRSKPTMVNLKSVKVPTSDAKNSSKVTTTKILTDTSVLSSSTTTTLVYKNISINLSTPIDEETITSDSIPVRTIINGATSGTCTVTFEKTDRKMLKSQLQLFKLQHIIRVKDSTLTNQNLQVWENGQCMSRLKMEIQMVNPKKEQ
jgi:hypothetical protein